MKDPNIILLPKLNDNITHVIETTIVIPAYRPYSLLKNCIDSIIENSIMEKLNIIVVCNGSDIESKNYILELNRKNIKLIWHDEALGFTAAANIGLKLVTTPYVILMNTDVTIVNWGQPHEWIDRLINPMKENSNIAVTGTEIMCFYFSSTTLTFIPLYCSGLQTKLIEQVGYFDEIFSPGYGEDVDLCAKLVNSGYELKDVNINGWFPIIHSGHHSYTNEADRNQLCNRAERILNTRYNNLQKIKYSIIISTYNHCDDLLKPCIESIKQYTNLSNTEVIIVANGCTDNTKEYVESLGDSFKLIWHDNAIGYTKATNEGIKASTGEYIILLNNDIILLPQKFNEWIQLLELPFNEDNLTGITGPLMEYNNEISYPFLIFFCVMIPRKIINEIGSLDEIFSPGGREDTDYCIKVSRAGYKIMQVPTNKLQTDNINNTMIGEFPIYHKGEGTMHDITLVSNWNETINTNTNILINRYRNIKLDLSNYLERAVFDRNEQLNPREHSRYDFARKNLYKQENISILEIGCSAGYGLRYFKDLNNITYTGLDYDEKIINYAKEQYHDIPFATFKQFNLEEQQITEFYDIIIAYEVIEHLSNGLELAQELKKHCNQLFITTPYKEPVGFWGPWHKLHNLTEYNFKNFNYHYIHNDGVVELFPDPTGEISLLLMDWNTNMIEVPKLLVTCSISTRNRYFTTLPLCLMSIINQTTTPDELLIFDDGEHKDLRNEPIYYNIFKMLNAKNINWRIIFGTGEGQVKNHQTTLLEASHDLIWRLDDDNIPEYNVLETLLSYVTSDTGAIAGLVFDPKNNYYPNIQASNKIADIYKGLNEQWFLPSSEYNTKEVDHLYSTFLFRKSAANHGYELSLSRVGHREETIFTHEMKRAGWKLLLTPKCTTWHFHEEKGGIRDNSSKEMFDHDEYIFSIKMKQWNENIIEPKLIVLNSGLGDHFAFKLIFKQLQDKFKEEKFIIACCYPDVFYDIENITLISLRDIPVHRTGESEKQNIYKWMAINNWKYNITKAYECMYNQLFK